MLRSMLPRIIRGSTTPLTKVSSTLLAARTPPSPPHRTKCSISDNIQQTPPSTGGVELTFLGTSSQGGARRYPSSLALRLRGATSSQVWIFDAGEGASAQLQRSNMRVGMVRNVFITHLHGDHLFGLPGLIMSVLGRRDDATPVRVDSAGDAPADDTGEAKMDEATGETRQRRPQHGEPVHVFGPPGTRAFLRTALGVSGFRVPFRNALFIHELVWPYKFGPAPQRHRHLAARSYFRQKPRELPFEGTGRNIEPQVDEQGQYTYDVISVRAADDRAADACSNGDGAAGVTLREVLEFDGRRGLELTEHDAPASVVAAPVLHTVPTFAYCVREMVPRRRFDKERLLALGVPSDGRAEVRRLFEGFLMHGRSKWRGADIDISDVLQAGRQARHICVVGDTYDASPAAHIARGADVLVHEATNMAAQTLVARERGHSTTLEATAFAKRVSAKRLVLNHTSVAYSERRIRSMEFEARAIFGARRVFVARDLSVFNVPTVEEDGPEFVFRRFVGFADSMEYRSPSQQASTLVADFEVDVSDAEAEAEEGGREVDGEDGGVSDDVRSERSSGGELPGGDEYGDHDSDGGAAGGGSTRCMDVNAHVRYAADDAVQVEMLPSSATRRRSDCGEHGQLDDERRKEEHASFMT